MQLYSVVYTVLVSTIWCSASSDILDPTVTIAFVARNAASNLPWFLGAIENLNYPKHRIAIW